MPLGILEPRDAAGNPIVDVPGTVDVFDRNRRNVELLETGQHLKKDKSGKIILNPQPSEDPNDPLVRLTPEGGCDLY